MCSLDSIDVATSGVIFEHEWDNYKPSHEWYLHDPFGIHGLGHASRVLVWSNLIGHWMLEQGIKVDLEVVSWAATLHDVRRVNDGKDPLHGERCGIWIDEIGNIVLGGLSDEQRKQIAYCCTWHVPIDRDIPKLTPELICLKDADALDRVRLASLDPRFIRTEYAQTIVKQAKFLCHTSEARTEFNKMPWDAVRQAAQGMNLWSPIQPVDCEWLRNRLQFFVC